MSIIPRIPAHYANMLLAYWAAQARRSTFLHPLSYRTLLSLLSKVYFAVLWILTNVHTILIACLCLHPISTFELHNSTLYPSMLNAICMIIQTKNSFCNYKVQVHQFSYNRDVSCPPNPNQYHNSTYQCPSQFESPAVPYFCCNIFSSSGSLFYFCCNTQPPQTMYALPYLTPNTIFECSSDWFGW